MMAGEPGAGGEPMMAGEPGAGGDPMMGGEPGAGGDPMMAGEPGAGGEPMMAGQPGEAGAPEDEFMDAGMTAADAEGLTDAIGDMGVGVGAASEADGGGCRIQDSRPLHQFMLFGLLFIGAVRSRRINPK